MDQIYDYVQRADSTGYWVGSVETKHEIQAQLRRLIKKQDLFSVSMSSQPAFLRGRGRGRGSRNPAPANQAAATSPFGPRAVNGNGFPPQRPGYASAASQKSSASPRSPGYKSPGLEKQSLEASLRSVEDMFAKARTEHMESAQRYLQGTAEDLDDSEDEEEDIGSLVLNGVFKSYASSYANDSGDHDDVNSAQEKLLHSFRSGTSACLVCIETIKKDEPIWSCVGCYCMFHIPCIQKWVREGVYQKQYSSGEFSSDKPTDHIPWFCPKCRHEYSQSECPSQYYCFCGKQRDPKFDPWLVPHSCGNVCGRQLKPNCGHTCLLLCHPGPCPPCPVMGKTKCYCGKSSPRATRCSAREWACGKVCGRTLSCRQHTCPEKCHAGECAPCTKTSLQACCCGKQKSERPCDSVSWKCDKVCGKTLSCGNHVCEEVCHSGRCGECPRSGRRKCPCGKTEFQLPCTEDIPTCGDTCSKPLTCGAHTCTQRCHLGECGQCMQMAVKKCRCGQRQKEIPCYKEFQCDKKCSNMRNCGVHKCNRKCCDGGCPSCEQICGKTLRCRNHKCASRCHKGPCYPCPLTVDISCFCKKTKISVPCGRERETKPPKCKLPCLAPSECHHPARQKHRCHFGECPPCSFVCGQRLKGCEHSCPLKCHDAVKTRFEEKAEKGFPWETTKVRIEKVAKPCPPCQVPIPTQCLGRHETSDIPCHRVKPYSCGRVCGRKLACGNHVCQQDCHTVTGAPSVHEAGAECPPCDLGCEAKRPKGCNHACVKPCHSAPCPPCLIMVRMRCHCQTLVKHIECNKWLAASTQLQDTLKSCGQPCPKEMACGHPCGQVCHSGVCPNVDKCEKKVTLRCKCRRIKKEMVCRQKATAVKPVCDENCKSNKKNDDESTKKKEEEEKRKQEAELEEYERMMKGRKKKPRKQREEIVEESFLQKYKLYMVAFMVCALALVVGAVVIMQVES
ncbi:NF-X1-type zinc finger protein NFXL1 isoform X2 [Aplysia californica]|uniref:NF-X1-type zinc finger protein NFXL1 isoform X2 n=1 Tax=Aplysia californica TaxID=6500 RepID=A0ABM0JCY4_APLCA|nr:NF-X1-type zinc finger protein NFXL1 isoform X2 [Aplysia californica]